MFYIISFYFHTFLFLLLIGSSICIPRRRETINRTHVSLPLSMLRRQSRLCILYRIPPSQPTGPRETCQNRLYTCFLNFASPHFSTILSPFPSSSLTNQVDPPLPPTGEDSVGLFHSPSLNSDKITENKDVKKWIDNYLGVGEWVMDQSVAVFGSTTFFERKR